MGDVAGSCPRWSWRSRWCCSSTRCTAGRRRSWTVSSSASASTSQRTIERVADTMTTLLDLNRIVLVINETVDRLLRPHGHVLLILDDGAGAFRPMGADRGGFLAVPAEAALVRLLARRPAPLTRERLSEDPDLSGRARRLPRHLREHGRHPRGADHLPRSRHRAPLPGPAGGRRRLHHRGPPAHPLPRQPERGGAGEREGVYRAGDGPYGAAVRAAARADPGVDPDQPGQVRAADRPGPHRAGPGRARCSRSARST